MLLYCALLTVTQVIAIIVFTIHVFNELSLTSDGRLNLSHHYIDRLPWQQYIKLSGFIWFRSAITKLHHRKKDQEVKHTDGWNCYYGLLTVT